jgi:hypothetical protein
VILVTSLAGAAHDCEVSRLAAAVVCDELKFRINGRLPDAKYFRRVTELGALICDEGWAALHDAEADEILLKYN